MIFYYYFLFGCGSFVLVLFDSSLLLFVAMYKRNIFIFHEFIMGRRLIHDTDTHRLDSSFIFFFFCSGNLERNCNAFRFNKKKNERKKFSFRAFRKIVINIITVVYIYLECRASASRLMLCVCVCMCSFVCVVVGNV